MTAGAHDAELLRAALDHIAKTAAGSRTSTRRLRWIEQRARWALEGKQYDREAFDMPTVPSQASMEQTRERLAQAKLLLARLVREVNAGATTADTLKAAGDVLQEPL